jgi:branched-chain amino acid transport system substrate-binding protein
MQYNESSDRSFGSCSIGSCSIGRLIPHSVHKVQEKNMKFKALRASLSIKLSLLLIVLSTTAWAMAYSVLSRMDRVLVMATFAVLMASVIFVVVRHVLRPLEVLSDLAERVSRGELDAVIKTSGIDAIGQIARAVNRLRVSLRSAMARIGELHASEALIVDLPYEEEVDHGSISDFASRRPWFFGISVVGGAGLLIMATLYAGMTEEPPVQIHLASANSTRGTTATRPGVATERMPGAPGMSGVPGMPSVRGVTDDSVTVGMSAAFSGASRELGMRMKLGLETAFAQVNESGGVHGRQLKLTALDDQYDGKLALGNVRDLIDQRHVFAVVGDVGTPTAAEAMPYVVKSKTIFFGAFTGAAILRTDPPDRYVFNYRASYAEETAAMINYLISVKKVSERSIVVFAQNDSYGDAGFDGVTKTLRKLGRSDAVLRVGYDRNTIEVDDAVGKVVEYHNGMTKAGGASVRHPVKAIIMVGTYRPCAKFIQQIRDQKIDATFLNVSFVGSDSLAEEIMERGPAYGTGVIVTQVVPHPESGASGVLQYRDALRKYHSDQRPDFVSLEGYVVGQLFAEGLRRAGHDLSTEALVAALEGMRDYDPAIGGVLSFGASSHQASHRVWGTVLDTSGAWKSMDME